jgi:hypothetical protein
LTSKHPRRRLRVVETIAIELPGHPSQEVAWLGFDPGRDLNDRVQTRHPKTALQQADLGAMQARSFGGRDLGEVRSSAP